MTSPNCRRVRSVALSVLATIGVVAGSASAAPITIIETTDLSNTAPGSTIGTLDVGINTFSGSVEYVSDPADYFQVDLPLGTDLIELSVSITNCCGATYTGGVLTALTSGTFGTSLPFVGPVTITNAQFTFSNSPIISGPNTIGFQFISGTAVITGGELISGPGFDYALNLNVVSNGDTAPIPEPASLVLLGTGLAGTWRSIRKRRAKITL